MKESRGLLVDIEGIGRGGLRRSTRYGCGRRDMSEGNRIGKGYVETELSSR